MAENGFICPYCGNAIPAASTRSWRPFGCPSCGKIVELRPWHGKFQTVGCLSTFVTVSIGLFLFGFHLLSSLGIGLILSIILTNIGFRLLERYTKHPPRLAQHILRVETATLVSLADFLDGVASSQTWDSDFNHRLEFFTMTRSGDEELENVAIEIARQLRAHLIGTRARKVRERIESLTPPELREEILAIVRDLRLAAAS